MLANVQCNWMYMISVQNAPVNTEKMLGQKIHFALGKWPGHCDRAWRWKDRDPQLSTHESRECRGARVFFHGMMSTRQRTRQIWAKHLVISQTDFPNFPKKTTCNQSLLNSGILTLFEGMTVLSFLSYRPSLFL